MPPYHHLLRAMDRLIGIKETAEPLIAKKLISECEGLDLVFYDITSTYFEGERSLADDDFRRYGYSRDHRPDRRQVVVGLMMTREGIPLCHHVFPGNTADKTTVSAVVQDLKKRFNLTRAIFVGDRGMLSEAVRFVVAYSPQIAAETRANRQNRLKKADAWIREAESKLATPPTRGSPPTLQGTYDRIRDYLRDKGLLSLYDLDSAHGKLSVKKNRKAINWEETIDGMLMVETTNSISKSRVNL